MKYGHNRVATREAALLLGVHRSTITRWARAGRFGDGAHLEEIDLRPIIPFHGKVWLIDTKELVRLDRELHV